jgi:hypothetical protein
MKAKYILITLLILAAGFEIYRIEKRFNVLTLEIRSGDRATITIPSLAPAAALNDSDQFLIADGGVYARRLAGAKIVGAIHDTATTLRAEMPLSGGAGVVDTFGLPVANQFTYFTAADKIGSSDVLTQSTNGDTVKAARLKATGDIFWTKFSGISGNYALIMNGSTHKLDTATLVPAASQAWRDNLGFWPFRFLVAKSHKALPLPNRKGEALRYIEPSEGTYQIEYELEMVNRGLFQLWIFWFVSIAGVIVYIRYKK